MFSTHLHSLAATLMESENSSFIDKIWSQPPLAVATQQGRKDVIKACVALSFDMNSMMRIFTRKSTPLERSRIRQDLETDAFLNRGIRQFLFSKTSRELDIDMNSMTHLVHRKLARPEHSRTRRKPDSLHVSHKL